MKPRDDYEKLMLDELPGNIYQFFVEKFPEPTCINYSLLQERLCTLFKPFCFNSNLYVRDVTQNEREVYCREGYLVRHVILEIFSYAADLEIISKYRTYAKERRELFDMIKYSHVVTSNPFTAQEGNLLYDSDGAFELKSEVRY